MKIKVSSTPWGKINEEILVLPVFEGEEGYPIAMPKKDREFLDGVLADYDFKGKRDEAVMVLMPGTRAVKKGIAKVCVIGLGKREEIDTHTHRRAMAVVARDLVRRRKSTVAVYHRGDLGDRLPAKDAAKEVIEGLMHGAYRFDRYKKDETGYKGFGNVHLVSHAKAPLGVLRAGAKAGLTIGETVDIARDMANTPAGDLYPESWGEWVKKESRGIDKLRTRVMTPAQLKKAGMGALLGVGQGSPHGPRMFVMEYRGGAGKQKPVVFVGKGVTFDTGGLQIKGGKGMNEMMYDMCGGSAVIGAVLAVARLKMKINLIGLVPAAENLPSGHSYKPSDIVKAADGTTIEIGHTDAEGRLCLAEALIYARRYKPEYVVDLATLTGAVMIALGESATGLFSDDDELAEALLAAGKTTGDPIWRLPLDHGFKRKLKSRFADINNSASDSSGGAISAAIFLHHFAGEYRWAHCDIAGTAWVTGDTPTQEKGATGWGVKFLVDLARAGLEK